MIRRIVRRHIGLTCTIKDLTAGVSVASAVTVVNWAMAVCFGWNDDRGPAAPQPSFRCSSGDWAVWRRRAHDRRYGARPVVPRWIEVTQIDSMAFSRGLSECFPSIADLVRKLGPIALNQFAVLFEDRLNGCT